MRRRYGSLVTQALLEQSPGIALDAYEQTENLPQTETEMAFKVDGYTVNGNFTAGNDAFIILHKGFRSYLLKGMSKKETSRASALLASIRKSNVTEGDLTKSCLTTFELFCNRDKLYMIMPHYVNTLEILPVLTKEEGMILYRQMKEALDFLHNLPDQYNHMDVKPSNICIRESGVLVLIDLGSVVPLGSTSESTRVYLPSDFQQRNRSNPTSNMYKAESSNDWWMLAMTVAEKVYALPVGLGATSPPLMSELRNMLNDEVWVELVAKLVG
jgi:serine/threonine protein kinase